MTPKQIEKELKRQETLFEEQVKSGVAPLGGNVRFEEYAKIWLSSSDLAPKTHERYEGLLARINPAIGHIRIGKLRAHDLKEFYKTLAKEGIKEKGRYAMTHKLCAVLENKKLSRAKLSSCAGVAPSTVGAACRGARVSIETAQAISSALGVSMQELFDLYTSTDGLSERTILHHHRLISAILAQAKREQLIPFNVAAEHMKAPKMRRKRLLISLRSRRGNLFASSCSKRISALKPRSCFC